MKWVMMLSRWRIEEDVTMGKGRDESDEEFPADGRYCRSRAKEYL